MQVLLTTLNAKYIHTNLAIRLLYSLNKDYEGLQWKEFTIKEDKGEVSDYCAQFDVVAFSCYIWNITPTLEVAKKIKQKNPNTKILLGGPEVSYEYNNIIALPEIDYIIVGEGEIPFKEFLDNYPNVGLVTNLVHKQDNEVKLIEKSVMFDLKNYQDIMPYAYDKPGDLFNKVLYIETSRGCPYKCEFCLASLDNKVRYLPIESIKATLLFLMQNGRVIKFLDRTFNIKRDFTIDIFSFILANYKPGNVFQFEITADILHPDIIDFIHKNVPDGLFRFEIGIQTVNQKANLEVSRKQNFEKTKSIINQLSYKVEMHLDLIVGLALDYFDDIKYSFEEVFKLHAPELQLGFLKFLKGTPVRDKSDKHGFVYDPMPPYQIIESNYLSKFELEQIVILENALEIYWNKNRAQHTLKYITQNYSSFDFLLGLGLEFNKEKDFHNYALNDVYYAMERFINANYPNDVVLKQLMAIDYYLQYKIKPKQLFIEELDKDQKFAIIDQQQLNHHKFRYTIFNIDFNFEVFATENKIVKENYVFIVEYNGQEKPHYFKQSVLI